MMLPDVSVLPYDSGDSGDSGSERSGAVLLAVSVRGCIDLRLSKEPVHLCDKRGNERLVRRKPIKLKANATERQHAAELASREIVVRLGNDLT